MDYLSLEINNLRTSIIRDEKITISNQKLMEIYSCVYNLCINDRSPEKLSARSLLEFFESKIVEFIQYCHDLFQEYDLKNMILLLKKYFFFCKNLNFMFRYAQKIAHYDEYKTIRIFKNNLFHEFNLLACQKIRQSINVYYLDSKLLSLFHELHELYLKYGLDTTYFYEILLLSFRDHYLNGINNINCFNDLILFYETKKNEIHLFHTSSHIEINIIDTLFNCLHNPNIVAMIADNMKEIFYKKDVEILQILHEINPDIFLDNIKTILHDFICLDNFETIRPNHEYIMMLSSVISEKILLLSEEKYIYCFQSNNNFIANVVKKIFTNRDCHFLIKYIENKEFVIKLFAKLILNKLSNNFVDFDNITFHSQEIKKIVPSYLGIKLDQFLMEIKNSIFMNRYITNKTIGSVYYISNVSFLTNPLMNFEYIHPEFEKIKCDIIHNYKSQFPNRKISFNYWQSMVHFIYYINTLQLNIRMPIIQFFAFELIMKYKQINFKDLNNILRIDSNILSSILHSLVNLYPIVLKSGAKNCINDSSDYFQINPHFTRDNVIFHLPNMNETKSCKMTDQKENSFAIRAKIVWLLKKNKIMTFSELVNEIKYLHLNEHLEYLIENEYIELNDKKYVYVM